MEWCRIWNGVFGMIYFVVYQINEASHGGMCIPPNQRPRGGLVRVREFDMKDAYSFDYDQNGLDEQYNDIQKSEKLT